MDFFFYCLSFMQILRNTVMTFFKSEQQLNEHLFKMFLLHVNRSLRSKFNT